MEIDELYHHGILGMKWGIRRYQPYGQGGYDPKSKGKNVGEAAKAEKKQVSSDYQKMIDLKKKGKAKYLTNEELQVINERARLEKEFYDYKERGESYVGKVMVNTGAQVLGKVATAAIMYAGAKYLVKKYNINPETITKSVLDAAGSIGAATAKEIAKGGTTIAKDVAKGGVKAATKAGQSIAKGHRKVRTTLANTDAAKKYVKALDPMANVIDDMLGLRR